ncbi:MAG: hypothetical protein WAO71_14455 [Gallionella sp.]
MAFTFRFFVFLAAILFSFTTIAAPKNDAAETVIHLYKDFAWEAVFIVPWKINESLSNASPEVLGQYFDDQLVSLLIKDRNCGLVFCNLDFSPMWESMDPLGASIVIRTTDRPDVVTVEVRYFNGNSMLTYFLRETSAGWKIRDIDTYKGSLLSILSKPYEKSDPVLPPP